MLTLFVILLALGSATLLTLLFRMLFSSARKHPTGESERPLFPHDPAIDGQSFEQAPA